MDAEEEKPVTLSHNELQDFTEHLNKSNGIKFTYTLEYLDIYSHSQPENPSKSKFSLAILHEILSNLKSSHVLWSKIKYAAFLLNIAEKNIDFSILYDIFHQAEVEVYNKNYEWSSDEVRNLIEDEIISKVIVKEQLETSSKDDLNFTNIEDDLEKIETNEFKEETVSVEDLESNHNKKRKPKRIIIKNEATDFEKAEAFNDELDPNENYKQEDFQPPKKKCIKKSDSLKKKGVTKKLTEKGGSFKCSHNQCKFKTRYQSVLDKHAFEKHKDSRLCIECGHLSSTYQEFIEHEKTHAMTCEICHLKLLGRRSLIYHIKTVHENKDKEKVPCDICGVFRTPESLRNHKIAAHGSHEVHKCDLCDFTTTNKSCLKPHMKRHFKKEKKCPNCGKMVKDLNKHYQIMCSGQKRERPSCELCAKTFSFVHGLKRHMKVVHGQGGTEYRCHLCDFACKQNSGLKQHIKGKHEKQKLFEKCPLCEKITSNMKYHLKTNHYDEYIKLYPSEDPSLPTPILGRTMIQPGGAEENFDKVEFAYSSSCH